MIVGGVKDVEWQRDRVVAILRLAPSEYGGDAVCTDRNCGQVGGIRSKNRQKRFPRVLKRVYIVKVASTVNLFNSSVTLTNFLNLRSELMCG